MTSMNIANNKYLWLHVQLLTYLLNPRCRVLLEQLTGLQLVKKFPAFHRTRRFITALTSIRHLSLSRASPIQSTFPHPTSWRSILILSTHLRPPRSPQWSLSLRLPHQDPIHPSLLTHTRHMPTCAISRIKYRTVHLEHEKWITLSLNCMDFHVTSTIYTNAI